LNYLIKSKRTGGVISVHKTYEEAMGDIKRLVNIQKVNKLVVIPYIIVDNNTGKTIYDSENEDK